MSSKKFPHTLIQYWNTERFLVLLVSLLLLLVSSPFLKDLRWFGLIRSILMTWIFLEIFNTTTRGKKRLVFNSLLVGFAIAALWVDNFFGTSARILALTSAIIVIYLFFSIVVLAKFIFGAESVGREVIYAAIIIYLLISIVWGYFYITLEFFVPGSFTLPFEMDQSDKLVWLMYFSYVTITTLGYGDITPLNAKASMLASTEALIGQIYLVVIVAWLVGMHVSQRSKKE
ncbi:MAG: ion channel [Thermodesulfobacteriota bacterium]|nr:ion channel [Thermodesulfobacteriota bacterium]